MPAPLTVQGCAVVFVACCWITDLRTRRIPNLLTATTFMVGIALNFALLGGWGLTRSAGGVAVAMAVLLPPFALGGIGGGDVKMMAAVGALLGPQATAASLVLGMILGGLVMVVHLVRLGRLRETLASLYEMVAGALLQRSAAPLKAPAQRRNAIALPYSVPLGLATIGVVAAGRLAGS